MALRADRVLQPSLAVLRNTPREPSLANEKNSLKNSLVETVSEISPDQIPNNLGIPLSVIFNPPTVIDIDDLIGDLKDIAKNHGKHLIGFHEIEQSEKDRILSNTAQGLSEILIEQYDNPDERIAVKAFTFVNVCNLIKILEEISRKRGSSFGLKSSIPKEDEMLAKRAEKQIELLINSPGRVSLDGTKHFLENYQVICELEGVAKRKLNNSEFGFAEHGHEQKYDIEIGNKALEYAKAIKLNDDEIAVNKAILFLELAQGEKSMLPQDSPAVITEPVFHYRYNFANI